MCRTNLYRPFVKQKKNDELAVAELKSVAGRNPYYGVARFAMALNWSEDKARRIRNLAGVTAAKRSKKHRHRKVGAEVSAPVNALRPYIDYANPERPWEGASFDRMAAESGAWVQDFTYIYYRGQWVYLAAVVELLTRRILGWNVGLRHTAELVHGALLNALSDNEAPPIIHDDQGGEYLSFIMQNTNERNEIQLSCSDKSSPWQNGFMESAVGTIKTELGDTRRFKTLEELYEGIAHMIYYYNHERIHTSLRMSPVEYANSIGIIDKPLTLVQPERVFHGEVRR